MEEKLVRLAIDVRSLGNNGRGVTDGNLKRKFRPSAPLLVESAVEKVEVPLQPREVKREVIRTPVGDVEVDPREARTLKSQVLDEVANLINRKFGINAGRNNTAFSTEPDGEYEMRLNKLLGGTAVFQQLWNDAADKVDPPKPFANRFEAVAAELEDPKKKP